MRVRNEHAPLRGRLPGADHCYPDGDYSNFLTKPPPGSLRVRMEEFVSQGQGACLHSGMGFPITVIPTSSHGGAGC